MTNPDIPLPRLADVYAVVDGRPSFGERERLSPGEEMASLLAYLNAGHLIGESTTRDADVVDRLKGRSVPAGHRTDGFWIWSDAVTYYLNIYGFAPQPDFLRHIRARQYRYEQPSADRVLLAGDVLDRTVRSATPH
ncbi:conserved hypothetical protein [Frankia canadensis]|uniref:Uncharacterized protein n=1 Tax=Frankia canadensis TaxID=1836972 RepID=A0A2I2L1W3_9ACTN|nr:hypothetical protein [Frankia canadensis]SNQ51926.1 conserved hypothetical protein [Frankia canadensis]SOU59216.1 conserved hypothetical protein [Frankia canadensis]